MARSAKVFALACAAVPVAIAGPALATEAHYTCSGGGKLSANFSPPDAAKGEVKLTFDTGRELSLAASPVRRWRALRQRRHRVLDQGTERDPDHERRQGNLLDPMTWR